ncbi:hypothetical protein F4678DRAFT_312358 [Xylaria arbuscula]|nr:hypothetical protein F4678DRAFT_312358 [Xylaria arbuscula]
MSPTYILSFIALHTTTNKNAKSIIKIVLYLSTTMLTKLLTTSYVVLPLIHRVQAQAGTTPVGPLLECTLTTFSCPGVSGCCTIGGCCGSGCCANGYTCINEGTSEETCCPASDPNKCGTAATPSSSGSNSGSGSHTCTGISNCRDSDGSTWTCLLGQTCGYSYRDCDPCPYIGGNPSPSSTSSFPYTTSPSTSSTVSFPSSSSSVEPSPTPSSGGYPGKVKATGYWLAAVGVIFMYLL